VVAKMHVYELVLEAVLLKSKIEADEVLEFYVRNRIFSQIFKEV